MGRFVSSRPLKDTIVLKKLKGAFKLLKYENLFICPNMELN